MRTHYASDTSKSYYITGAPQCIYPDASLGPALNSAWFDMVMVQFYNNSCGLGYYSNNLAWNYGVWDYWATHVSVNPNVKILIGAPASSTASGSGYVALSQLQTIAQGTYNSARAFGGIMFWDASQAWQNPVGSKNYAQGTKAFLKSFGCSASSLPACTALAYNPGSDYSGNSEVTISGYTFINRWWTQGDNPATDFDTSGGWNIIGACGGSSPATTTSTTSTTSPTTSSSTTSTSTKPKTTTLSTTSTTSTTTTTTKTTSSPTATLTGNPGAHPPTTVPLPVSPPTRLPPIRSASTVHGRVGHCVPAVGYEHQLRIPGRCS
ncbi:glycoside hydrolase superfamily [Endogone sp. FLAS-F59071]|nr:glycoside hydrolase superfamily [Endogone sp. FLAS-F59071]|eukprot:RUS14481.1 glycoside hydrolase superfamily [Endogone sp. FLAS-F59071]